jgi:hypothetical protein
MNVQPWQLEMLKKMSGMKPGELKLTMAGRQAGKSYWTAQAIQRLMDDLTNNPVETILLNEGSVYGSRYYTAEPIGGNWLEMESWCLETYGSLNHPIWGENQIPEPAQRWYMNNRKFWFKNESDRIMFVLKWL